MDAGDSRIMKTQRFELVDGSTKKFWEISVSGASYTVRYGRIGSDGQGKTKKMAGPPAARAAAEKLIASKKKKGYGPSKTRTKKPEKSTPSTAKKSAKKKTQSAPSKTTRTKPAGPALTAEYKWITDKGFIGVWPDKRDLWIVSTQETPDYLDEDFMDFMRDMGCIERWRFRDKAAATKALSAFRAQKKKKATVPDWLEVDFKRFEKYVGASQPRIARFEVSKSGPVTMGVHTQHDNMRPPSRCRCGRVMMSTFALSGPLDSRFGARTDVFVSFCPGSTSVDYCDGSLEILVHGTKTPKAAAEHYFVSRAPSDKAYYVVIESVHWNPIGGSAAYVVTEHFGEKGTPGTLRSESFRKKKDFDVHLSSVLARAGQNHKPAKAGAFKTWYAKTLTEIFRYHRRAETETKKLKLRPLVPSFELTLEGIPASSELFKGGVDAVGGQPAYTQSDWDRTFECGSCGEEMLFIFQAGSGGPWWSRRINDGDAGSFQFFACACGSRHGRALFECH